MPNHEKTLVQEDLAFERLIAWENFAIYGLWAVVLSFIIVCGWFGYTSQIWLKSTEIVVVWSIERLALIFGLLTLIGLTATSVKILKRSRIEQNLRFDVYSAVVEVTSLSLARHLPDYQKLTTVVALGEELLKPVEQMSRRAARIQLALQKQFPGLGLAEAIDQFVRNSLQAADIAVTVTNIASILNRLDPEGSADNVVQLERPSA